MLTGDGPKVIEFNVRFGDPEAQVIMPFLEGQIARTLFASATSGLEGITLSGGTDSFVGVVLAAPGYPGPVTTGQPISGWIAPRPCPVCSSFMPVRGSKTASS